MNIVWDNKIPFSSNFIGQWSQGCFVRVSQGCFVGGICWGCFVGGILLGCFVGGILLGVFCWGCFVETDSAIIGPVSRNRALSETSKT